MLNMTKKQYAKLAKSKVPASHLVRDTAFAWLVGGGICVLGQFLLGTYMRVGLTAEKASAITAITLIALAAVLTALRIYHKIAKWAGGGTLVPITGFSNAMVSAAMEYRSEGLVTGLAAKMFSVAGSVLVYGLLASVIYGTVLWVVGFFL